MKDIRQTKGENVYLSILVNAEIRKIIQNKNKNKTFIKVK